MSFFEDPEWGNAKEVSYDTSLFTFEGPSSLLDNIQEVQDSKKDNATVKQQPKKKREMVEDLSLDVNSSMRKKKKNSPTKVLGKESLCGTSESSQKKSSNCKNTINVSKVNKILENGRASEEKKLDAISEKPKKKKSNKKNKYRELNILQQAKKNDLLVSKTQDTLTSVMAEKGGIEGLAPAKGSISVEKKTDNSGDFTVDKDKNIEQGVSKIQKRKKKKKMKGQSSDFKDDSRRVSDNVGPQETNLSLKTKSKDSKNLGKVSKKKRNQINEERKEERDVKNHNNSNVTNFEDDVEEHKIKQELEEFMQGINFENLKESSALSAELSSNDESECIRNISDSEEEYLGDDMQIDKRRDTQRNSDTAVFKRVKKNEVESSAIHLEDKSASNSEEQRQFSSDTMILTKLSKQHSSEKDVRGQCSKRPPLNSADALKAKMTAQLNAAQFRMLNEQMYTTTSSETSKFFKADKAAFSTYHGGFQSQVSQWPVNPLEVIIKWLKNKSKHWVVADFGCGDALLAASVPQKTVHSFDFVALNSRVTACDMSHTALPSCSVDVAVFCLSLMGTNIKDFILEASRVLKKGGILKIAEVQSRFKNANEFVGLLKKFGFELTFSEMTTKYFYMFQFKKQFAVKSKSLPDIVLSPCIYKKR